MTTAPFAEISARLRATRADWLPRVFPAGRIERGMFVLGNADGDAGRSFPIPLDGRKTDSLIDFGGERVGDDLDLFARGTRQSLADAAREASAWLGLGHRANKPSHGTKATTGAAPGHAKGTRPSLEPFPQGGTIPNHPQLGKPDGVWFYRQPDGRPTLAHLRFDERDADGQPLLDGRGKVRKQFRPLIWRGGRFRWEWPEGRPLYGLPELAARPDAPVLVVEGERTADTSRRLLPDMVVVAWPQGSSGVARADWTPLRGRRLVIWPDADEPGIKAGAAVAEMTRRAGATSVSIVPLPGGLPDGWDLADTVPAGWSTETIAELIAAAPVAKANGLEDETGSHSDAPPPVGDADDHVERVPRHDETFPVLSLRDCLARQSEPTRWLIDGVLPERGLACIFGRSNSFKSFVAIDQACHIAHGRPYHGRAVLQAPAMYLALEGSSGVIRQRVPGWHRHYGLLNTAPQLAIIETPVTLTKAPDAEKLKRTAFALWGRLPGLIVIDVLKRTMDGSETDDEVVARFIHSLQTTFLTDREPCLILVITHSGFSVDDRARGHSDLWGSYDSRLICEGDKENLTTCLTVERHKDAESGGAITFKLQQVETGMARDDLSPITTLVPVRDEAGAHQPKAQVNKKPKLKPAAQNAVDVLRNLLAESGEKKQGRRDIPNGVPVVAIEAWRQRCAAKGLSTTGSDDPKTKASAERMAFKRARQELEALGIVKTDDNASESLWVWIAQPAACKSEQGEHAVNSSSQFTVFKGCEQRTERTGFFRTCSPVHPVHPETGPSEADMASLAGEGLS